jgi:zinc transporter ZupT
MRLADSRLHPRRQVWGYSIAGALIASAASLVGALLLAFALAKGGSVSQFSIDMLGDVSIINAFPAGILLGLVFLHLIPESTHLTGAFDWRVSILIVCGFLLGLATEHILNILGLQHAHAGHSSTSAEFDRPKAPPAPGQVELGMAGNFTAGGSPPPAFHPAMPMYGGFGMAVGPVAYPQLSHHGAVPNASVEHEKAIAHEQAEVEAQSLTKPHGFFSPIVVNILVGDFFHNLFDGIAIGSAFLSCGGLGWVVTASVVVHELPQVR